MGAAGWAAGGGTGAWGAGSGVASALAERQPLLEAGADPTAPRELDAAWGCLVNPLQGSLR